MSHVTCFQHIDCEGPGTFKEILASKGVELRIMKPFQGEPLPRSIGDGLVVLGGPQGVYERAQHPWMEGELAVIVACLKGGLPVLGVCLGAQMLAHAAGGQVYRGALPEVGWYPVTLTPEGRKDPLLLGLSPVFRAFHWHGDSFTLPPGAARLAASDWYPNQAFRIGTNAYGLQFHLEVTEGMVEDWSRLYSKEFTPQGGPIRPERVVDGLRTNAGTLAGVAERVFTRFAALL